MVEGKRVLERVQVAGWNGALTVESARWSEELDRVIVPEELELLAGGTVVVTSGSLTNPL